ncbi:glycosyltransferase [Patescibacteria group bacterium]
MISIIIPCKKLNSHLQESLKYISNLEYTNFEVIVLPDEKFFCHPEQSEGSLNFKIIPTGAIKPGAKRNIGAQHAQGDILAFLDDDACPKSNWLNKVENIFKNSNIIAVGGPAITPNTDSFSQKVSGAVYLSKFSGANPDRYWPDKKVKQVDDWPSVNFFIRKKDFLQVSGFNENFYPGEDTKLCLDLIKNNKKIIYDPSVVVYHHRRGNLLKHLKQAGEYGLHRGYFAKKFPATSFKFKYFLPSLFFFFIVFGWLLIFIPYPFNLIYPILWLIYLFALLISIISITLKIKNIFIALVSVLYIIPTHFWYGFKFLQGILRK